MKNKLIIIFLFTFINAQIQVALKSEYDIRNDSHSSIMNAIGSLGQIDDQIAMGGAPIISLDLNGNGILDYVTAHHTLDNIYIYFDQIDFIENIYYPHEGFNPSPDYGSALLKKKGSENLDGNLSNLIISGKPGAAYLGSSFTSGDFNGDNVDDLLIGAYHEGGDGESFIIFGSNDMPTIGVVKILDIMDVRLSFSGFSGNLDLFGNEVCALDLNNDGFDDIVIAATVAWWQDDGSGRGSIYVIFGNSSLPNLIDARNESDVIIEGGGPFDHIGKYLEKGDFNNDNYEDLVFTSAYWPGGGTNGEQGKAWILFGSKFLNNYYNLGESHWDITGFDGQVSNTFMAFASVGDINGDGIDDLILARAKPESSRPITDLVHSTFLSSVFINYGPIALGKNYYIDEYPKQTKIFSIGESSFSGIESKLGQSMAIYDINDDGYDDFLIGAPGWTRTPSNWDDWRGSRTTEGAAFLFMGGADLPDTMSVKDHAISKFLAWETKNNPNYNISFGKAVNIIKMNTNKIYATIADNERSKIYFFNLDYNDCSPYNIETKALSNTKMIITWNSDCESITGYSLERYSDNIWEKNISINSGITEFIDTGLVNGKDYIYRLKTHTNADEKEFINYKEDFFLFCGEEDGSLCYGCIDPDALNFNQSKSGPGCNTPDGCTVDAGNCRYPTFFEKFSNLDNWSSKGWNISSSHNCPSPPCVAFNGSGNKKKIPTLSADLYAYKGQKLTFVHYTDYLSSVKLYLNDLLVWESNKSKESNAYLYPDFEILQTGILNVRFEGSPNNFYRGYIDDLRIK
tara:strand:+ start:19660 stop:22056 length:2397 start_codon:yes stop_codon:yes gene_type:complete